MIEVLLNWDTELFLWLNNLGTPFWDPVWLWISEVFVWIPFYALLIFLLFRNLSLRNFGFALLLIGINTVLTDQGSVHLLKNQVLRLRPCHVEDLLEYMRLVKEGCGGKFGFVSSHASNTFGMAVLVGGIMKPFYPQARMWLLFWAAVVGYSRIYLGVHYPLDVIGGAALGAVSGLLVLKVYKVVRR